MKAPFFTFLIDTYKYCEFIEEAVSRALAQDFPPEERETGSTFATCLIFR